jgi:hypothetical protein
MRRHTCWRRIRSAGFGLVLFSIAVDVLYLLWPEVRPISFWAALLSSLAGFGVTLLGIMMASHTGEQVQRAREGLPAESAIEPVFYGLVKAGLVLGSVLVSVGLPGAGACWLVQWLFSSQGKTAPAVMDTGIAVGLTLAIAGVGLLAIALIFVVKMRRDDAALEKDDTPEKRRARDN